MIAKDWMTLPCQQMNNPLFSPLFHLCSLASMPTILICGAASGLGAAFLNAFHKEPENTFIAIDRDAMPPRERTEAFAVDISSQDSINAFAQKIQGRTIEEWAVNRRG